LTACLYALFFRVQRSEPKKGQPNTWSAKADCPALLEMTGSLKTRGVYTPLWGAQTSQTPVSAISAVLGGVKWQKQNNFFCFAYSPFQWFL
jgi:hypothetical protein